MLLAERDAHSALTVLRDAWTVWQEMAIPYEAARVRVLIGLACRTLGDAAAAEMEFDAARRVFEELGAAPDVDRVEALSRAATRACGRPRLSPAQRCRRSPRRGRLDELGNRR